MGQRWQRTAKLIGFDTRTVLNQQRHHQLFCDTVTTTRQQRIHITASARQLQPFHKPTLQSDLILSPICQRQHLIFNSQQQVTDVIFT